MIREELAGEVGRAVSAGEYEEIVADRVLRTHRIEAMRPRASAALVNASKRSADERSEIRDHLSTASTGEPRSGGSLRFTVTVV